jgi:hypothetical protein
MTEGCMRQWNGTTWEGPYCLGNCSMTNCSKQGPPQVNNPTLDADG